MRRYGKWLVTAIMCSGVLMRAVAGWFLLLASCGSHGISDSSLHSEPLS